MFTSLHKKISKKKSSWCRDISMHECTGWQSTQTRSAMYAHSDMHVHSITWPHYATIASLHKYSSKFSANWCATATYVGAGWLLPWPCYRVHITVCMALLVCVLCQPVRSCIETSLHQLDFFSVTRCRPRACGWCVIRARVELVASPDHTLYAGSERGVEGVVWGRD